MPSTPDADAQSAGAVWTLGKNLVEHAMRA
jgi:hypothetical protein